MNAHSGNQSELRLWGLIRKGPAVVIRVLLPPATFEPRAVELTFLDHQARRTALQRRAGGILALFTWVAFSGLDYMNVGPASGAEGLLPQILSLRVLGTAAIAVGIFLTFRPKFLEHSYSTRMLYIFICLCYLLLLCMVADIEFPFSYLVDYPGLILYLMFILGLLRPNAKLILAAIVTVLPLSAFELNLSNIASIRNFVNLSSKEIHASLTFFLSYYYVSTMVYLTASMVVGYAIACQLERDARSAFLRESELEGSNRTFVNARRDLESTTQALIAAKEELLASAVRANQEKSKFLMHAVHDLKNTLTALNIFARDVQKEISRDQFGQVPNLTDMALVATQTPQKYFTAVENFSG